MAAHEIAKNLTSIRGLATLAAAGLIVAVFVLDGGADDERKSEDDRLRSFVDIVLKAGKKDGKLPESIDAALKSTDTTLSSRDEIFGLSYLNFDDNAF